MLFSNYPIYPGIMPWRIPPPPGRKCYFFFRMIPQPTSDLLFHTKVQQMLTKRFLFFFSNSFFLIPVFHFPWSEKGREARLTKAASHTA